MTSTTRLHPWDSTAHFPSLQPVSKTYYCTEQMLSWEAISQSRNSIYFMKPEGSLPWILSHLQGHFPSSLYKMIITTFLKELASKTFWIFFCTEAVEKVISEVILLFMWNHYQNLHATVHSILFKIHINLVLLPSS